MIPDLRAILRSVLTMDGVVIDAHWSAPAWPEAARDTFAVYVPVTQFFHPEGWDAVEFRPSDAPRLIASIVAMTPEFVGTGTVLWAAERRGEMPLRYVVDLLREADIVLDETTLGPNVWETNNPGIIITGPSFDDNLPEDD